MDPTLTATIELRQQAELDFVRAAFVAVTRHVVEPDELLAYCPPDLLSHHAQAKAVYEAIAALAADRKHPDPVTVGEWLFAHRAEYPHVGSADIANMCELSIMGAREETVLHLAGVVRREGLKQQAEGKLLQMLAACQMYGNEATDIAAGAANLAAQMEDGCADHTDYSLSAIMRRVMTKLESGEAARPLPTPWPTLNRVLKGGLVPGELAVLAARPGMGKTALAGCLSVETARKGHPVLFVSREVKDETVAARILSREARVDSRVFRQGIEHAPNILPKIRQAQDALDALPLLIVEKSVAPMTPREVRRIAKRMGGVGLIVVDYLQLMEADTKSNSREREVAEMSRSFKQLALDCNCPVLLLSQLNRESDKLDKEPSLSNLRESGAIEQDADIVIFLHTQKRMLSETTPPIKAVVAKGRSSGTGSMWLRFEKPFTNFIEGTDPGGMFAPKAEDNGL
jgi:replicative DNA helicase